MTASGMAHKRKMLDPPFVQYDPAVRKGELDYRHGSTVYVQMHDARTIEAKVCYIEDTVAGRKVTVISGSVVNRVDSEQIVAVIRK